VSSPDVREAVGGYLRVAAAGVFFEAANLAWGVFYLTISRTGVVLAATAVLAAANMLLDWCLIFGKLGAPEMGIRGAAAATVAAQGAAFCFFTIRAICGGDVRRYGLFSFRGGHRAQWRVLLGLSAPVTLEALVETARWFAFFAIIERMGEVALASATIVYCCYSVLLIPAEAFSEASCSMVSNLIGQGSAWRMGPVMRHALSLGYAVTLPLAAASAIFPEQALAIFTADDAAIEGGLGGLLVVAAALLVAVPGELLLGAVVGTGDTRALLIIEAAVTACVLGMTWTIAELRLPAHFAWLAVSAGWILRIALSLSRLRSGAWRALRV
jgi:Na+-driven multidrug efflux pump